MNKPKKKMNEAVSKYLNRVRLAFPLFQENEKRFYNEFKLNVLNYVEENPDCSIDDLNETFGRPDKVAIDYFDSMEASVYYALLKRSKYLEILVKAFIAFIVLALFIFSIYFQCVLADFREEMAKSQNVDISDYKILNNNDNLEDQY